MELYEIERGFVSESGLSGDCVQVPAHTHSWETDDSVEKSFPPSGFQWWGRLRST